MGAIKSFDEFIGLNESVKFKTEGVNFTLHPSIKDNFIWIQAMAASSKDLDTIKDNDYTADELTDDIIYFIKKKTKMEGNYDPRHPGAGYWIKINQYELEKLFK